MTTVQLTALWERLRLGHGIALRVIDLIPEARLDDTIVPKMRTPKQLVVHLYAMAIREVVESVARGEFHEIDEAAVCASIRNRSDLLRLCRESWEAAEAAVRSITDAQLAGDVKTPWGKPIAGKTMIGVARDEFHHHRGQLYTFVRVMGLEPPDMYDFANNAEEFRPKVATG